MKNRKNYVSYTRFDEIISAKETTSYRVAKETGISPMTISDWKNGKSKPKIDKLMKIANYLDVNVELFINEGDD